MHGDNMNINAETKKKLDDLLQDLKSNNQKIYYCSMAEVFQRNFVANFKKVIKLFYKLFIYCII